MPKNSYAKRLEEARAVREYAIRRYTRQQMLDFVTIALGRMGYGEKRLKDFEQTLSAVYIEFAEAARSRRDARQRGRDTASYINEGYHKRARKINRRSK